MTNSELYTKALAKVKDKNFSVASALTYTIAAIPLLAADITGFIWADLAIMYVVCFCAGLISSYGYAKLAMERFRYTQGGFRELFTCYTSVDELKRGALPAAVYAVMLMLFRYGVLSGVWYAAVFAGIACILLHIAAGWGSYMILMESDNCPVKEFGRGIDLAARSLARIIAVKAYLYWWIAAAIAVTLVLCGTRPLPGIFVGLIVFLVGLVCRWMVGAFIALTEAGLAREVYRG